MFRSRYFTARYMTARYWRGDVVPDGAGRGGLVRGLVWTPGATLGMASHAGASYGRVYTPGPTLGKLVIE